MVRVESNDSQRQRHEEPEPAGETVEAVNEVHDIWNGDEPEDSDRPRPNSQFDFTVSRNRKALDAQSQPAHEARCGHLSEQFFLRANARNVIPKTQRIHQRRPDQNREPLRRARCLFHQNQNQPQRQCQHDGHTTQSRNRRCLLFARFVGDIQSNATVRKLDDPRRRYHREQKAEHEKEKADNHGRGSKLLDLQKVVIAKGITNALAADVCKVESEVLLTSHHPSPCRKRIRTMSARIQRRSDFTTDPTGSNPISNRTGIARCKNPRVRKAA